MDVRSIKPRDFEKLVVEHLNKKNVLAWSTGQDASSSDVAISLGIFWDVRSIEVKMDSAQFGSPRFFFDGDEWGSPSQENSELAKRLVTQLNFTAHDFIRELEQFVGLQFFDKIRLLSTTDEKMRRFIPGLIDLQTMKMFLEKRRDQYVTHITSKRIIDWVKGHYKSKRIPTQYLQWGNSFYKLDPEAPSHPDVPVLETTGKAGVRVCLRSRRYEIMAEVKLDKPEKESDFSIIDSSKRFPF